MTDTDPTISVALAFYNGRPYLREQLDSILDQTRPPDEIVVGDDGSTDGSMDDVLDAQRRARERGLSITWTVLDRVRVGLQANKTRICAAAQGDVIVFCDSDDVCLPDRMRWVAEAFGADPALVFHLTDARVIDEHGDPQSDSILATQSLTPAELARYRSGEAFAVLMRRFMAHGAMTSMRRSFFDSAPPFDQPWHLDAWYAMLAAATGGFALDERPTIEYRQHSTNTSGGVRRRGWRDKLAILTRPGRDRDARLLAQARTLLAGLDGLGDEVPADARELAASELRHQETRSRYPAARVLRWPFVVREAATGRYTRHGRGRKDVLLDLVQPRG